MFDYIIVTDCESSPENYYGKIVDGGTLKHMEEVLIEMRESFSCKKFNLYRIEHCLDESK